jgi:hypothetical protein
MRRATLCANAMQNCDCPGRRIARVWCGRGRRIARHHRARPTGLTASPPFLANGRSPWHSTQAPSSPETRTAQARTVCPGTFPLDATLRDLTTPARPPYEAVQLFPARRIPHLSHSFQNLQALTAPTIPPSPNTPSHNSAKRLHYRPRLRSTRAAIKRKKHWTAAAARSPPISPSGVLRARCDAELSCGKCVGDLDVGFSRSRSTLPRQHTVPARRRSWS